MGDGNSSVDLSPNSKVWKGVWHAEASPKSKKILWRACKEGIPVRYLMIQKGIIEDNETCPVCGIFRETTTHAFLLCEEVKPIWFGSSLGLKMDTFQNIETITMAQWVDKCVDIYDKKAMGMVCAIVWALWYKRNAWLQRNRKLDFSEVMAIAWSVFVVEDWVPPLDPKVKANFAASVRFGVGTGLGVIFRNCHGEPMASATDYMEDDFDVEIAETICYKWAVEKSEELWFLDSIFETDCRELHIQWNEFIQGKDGDAEYLNELLDECKTMMQGTDASLTLVPNTANKVAQRLAKLAFDYGERVWIEEVPNEALPSLQADFSATVDVSDVH